MTAKPKPARPGDVYAVIDIGSSAIRLLVAEFGPNDAWRTLETAQKPVPLGRDVFHTGRIGRDTMVQSIKIMLAYRELLAPYDLKGIRAIGTSAVREARNRDIFVDRIRVRTGIEVDVIEGIEANHLTYLAVQHALKAHRGSFTRQDALIMEVGAGSTEMMVLQHARMVSAHTLRIGSARMEEVTSLGSVDRMERLLRERVENTVEVLKDEADFERIRLFIAVGGDARLAASRVGHKQADEWSVIRKADFSAFISTLADLSIDEIAGRYGVNYYDAEMLVPGLLVYKLFLHETAARQVVVPNVSIRDGVLIRLARGSERSSEQEFYRQTIASTLSLARKYRTDERHARQVADLALQLFDELQADHGLTTRHRVLLEVAALLHDIGTYINFSSHHKHGQYIIEASDVFGLFPGELRIVANVVRYHRKATPQPTHISYRGLPPSNRIAVCKLAAILRVADAMDRGHQERIREFEIERTDDELIIKCTTAGEITQEQLGVTAKSDLFEEVFGLKVLLV